MHQGRAPIYPARAAHADNLRRAAELLRRRVARGGAVDTVTAMAVCDLMDALTMTAAEPGLPQPLRRDALALARRVLWSDAESPPR